MEHPERIGLNLDNLQVADSLFLQLIDRGVEHVVDAVTQQEYIRYHQGVDYPTPSSPEARDILLKTVSSDDTHTYLELPNNYVTMAQALNDAIGDSPTPQSQDAARELFEELGLALAQVAQTRGLVPEHLDYRQVIFIRGEPGVRLLPPLALTDMTADSEVYASPDYRMLIAMQLLTTCMNGASNTSQRGALPAAFKGFVESFRWE